MQMPTTKTFVPSLHVGSLNRAQETAFHLALSCGEDTKFRKIYDRFSRQAPTDMGPGAHYLYGLVGPVYTGARETIYAVADHQGIPVLDLTTMTSQQLNRLPIRDIVQVILDTRGTRRAVAVRYAQGHHVALQATA